MTYIDLKYRGLAVAYGASKNSRHCGCSSPKNLGHAHPSHYSFLLFRYEHFKSELSYPRLTKKACAVAPQHLNVPEGRVRTLRGFESAGANPVQPPCSSPEIPNSEVPSTKPQDSTVPATKSSSGPVSVPTSAKNPAAYRQTSKYGN